MPAPILSPTASLHAITSSQVVLGTEVVAATVVYSEKSGKIIAIIRKSDENPVSAAAAGFSRWGGSNKRSTISNFDNNSNPNGSSSSSSSSDEETPEYYHDALKALGVPSDHCRDIGDLVLMPGLVDAHVHLNEVSKN